MTDYQAIIDDIRAVLCAHKTPLRASLMALEARYAAAVDEVNSRLKNCGALLQKGQRERAVRLCEIEPRLMGAVGILNFAERQQWTECIVKSKLPAPPELLIAVAADLRKASGPVQREPAAKPSPLQAPTLTGEVTAKPFAGPNEVKPPPLPTTGTAVDPNSRQRMQATELKTPHRGTPDQASDGALHIRFLNKQFAISLPVFIALGACGVLFLAGVVAAAFYAGSSAPVRAVASSAKAPDQTRPPAKVVEHSRPDKPIVRVTATKPVASVAPEAPKPEIAPQTSRDPFEDLEQRGRMLQLPARRFALDAAPTGEMAKLFVNSPKDCELKLVGEGVARGGRTFALTRKSAEDQSAIWEVTATTASSVGSPPMIGKFVLKDQSLSFRWEASPAAPWHDTLRYCLISIRLDEQTSCLCRLTKPLEIEPIALDLSKKLQRIELPSLDPGRTPDADLLRWDLELENVSEHEIKPQKGLKLSDSTVIKIFAPDGSVAARDKFIDIPVKIETEQEHRIAIFGGKAYPRLVLPDETVTTSEDDVWISKMFEGRAKCERASRLAASSAKKAENEAKAKAQLLVRLTNELGKGQESLKNLPGPVKQVVEAKLEDLKKTIAELPMQIDGFNKEAAHQANLQAFFDASRKWCEEVDKTLQELKSQGKLHLAVYLDVEGHRVEIVRTKRGSANQAAE